MISTGIRLGDVIPFAPGFESGSYNILFDPSSASTTSHTITVDEHPFVIEAFGLVSAEVVEVWSVGGRGAGQWFSPLYVNAKQVKLTATDNKLSLDVSGRYQFRLTAGGLGTVYVVGHDANVASPFAGFGKFVVGV